MVKQFRLSMFLQDIQVLCLEESSEKQKNFREVSLSLGQALHPMLIINESHNRIFRAWDLPLKSIYYTFKLGPLYPDFAHSAIFLINQPKSISFLF